MSAYESIRESILQGKYKPGERLTEENLAKELKLSRTPIREAIKKIEIEGLVTPLKRGVIVKKFTKEDIRQIYDLRTMIEGYAASQAAFFRKEENIEELKASHENFAHIARNYNEDFANKNKKIYESNNRFHTAVFNASQNEYIHLLISKVVVVPLIFRSFNWYDTEKLKRSVADHEAIMKAIINRDSERAETAMREHLYQGRDLVLKSLESTDLVDE